MCSPSVAHCLKWPRGSGRVCQTPELATPKTVAHNSASRVVGSYQTRWTGFCPDLVEACLTPSTDELPRWNGGPIAIMLPHPKPGSCHGAVYHWHRDERPDRRTSRPRSNWPNVAKGTNVIETRFSERAVMCESKERDWSRVTPRSLIWVVSSIVVPKMLTEPSVENVFNRWWVNWVGELLIWLG